MNKKELTEMLRPLIQEEVKKVLCQVLPKLLAESVSRSLPEKPSIPPQQRPQQRQQAVQAPKKPLFEMKGNPVLAEILNSTEARHIKTPMEEMAERHMRGQQQQQPPQQQMLTEGYENAEDYDVESDISGGTGVDISSIMTRDFSAILKKADSLAKSSRPM